MSQMQDKGSDGWVATWTVLVALIGLTIGGLGAMAGQAQSKRQVAPVRVAKDSGAIVAANAHQALLAEAAKLEPPTLLPPAQVDEGQANGTQPGNPQGQPAAEPALPPVPPEQRVVIGMTSSVIGEIDPCG